MQVNIKMFHTNYNLCTLSLEKDGKRRRRKQINIFGRAASVSCSKHSWTHSFIFGGFQLSFAYLMHFAPTLVCLPRTDLPSRSSAALISADDIVFPANINALRKFILISSQLTFFY